jgi:hypothetical protein
MATPTNATTSKQASNAVRRPLGSTLSNPLACDDPCFMDDQTSVTERVNVTPTVEIVVNFYALLD